MAISKSTMAPLPSSSTSQAADGGTSDMYLQQVIEQAAQIAENELQLQHQYNDDDENDVAGLIEASSSSSDSDSSHSTLNTAAAPLQEDHQPQQQQQQQPPRAIRFNDSVQYFEIIQLEEYSERELRKCWYSPEEKEKMNLNKDKVVLRLEAGKPPRSGMTYQGLQCWTTDGGAALDENIANAVNSVMDEQDRQWAANQDDFDRIAEISISVTAHCAEAARQIAIEDERLARLAWVSLEDMSMASEHSVSTQIKDDDIRLLSRKPSRYSTNEKFIKSSKKKKSKKSSSSSRKSKSSSSSSSVNDEDSVSSFTSTTTSSSQKKEKSKQRSKKSKKEKKSVRSMGDPPARVERSFSAEASDLLLQMARKAKFLTMKV